MIRAVITTLGSPRLIFEGAHRPCLIADSSDGRVVKASASGAADLGLIPSRVKPMTLKSVFTASLLDVLHRRDSVENKPASLLIVPLGKALHGIPPSWSQGVATGGGLQSSH